MRKRCADKFAPQATKEANLYEKFRLQMTETREALERVGLEVKNDKDSKSRVQEAATLACEIKDIRDELNIIKTITNYQKIVQDSLNGNRTDRDRRGPDDIPADTDGSATYIISDIIGMERVADRIHAAVGVIYHCVNIILIREHRSIQVSRSNRTKQPFLRARHS